VISKMENHYQLRSGRATVMAMIAQVWMSVYPSRSCVFIASKMSLFGRLHETVTLQEQMRGIIACITLNRFQYPSSKNKGNGTV
jgi:hypothetical protein